MVTTPPPMVLTMVRPRASVLVTTEPKLAAPPPTVLTMVTPAALVLVTRVAGAAELPLDEACVEPWGAPEDAGDEVADDAETPPVALLDAVLPVGLDDPPAEDRAEVLVTTTVTAGEDAITVVVLLMMPAADVWVVAVAGPTGAGATLIDVVSVNTLTGEDTVATMVVVVEGGLIVEEEEEMC